MFFYVECCNLQVEAVEYLEKIRWNVKLGGFANELGRFLLA